MRRLVNDKMNGATLWGRGEKAHHEKVGGTQVTHGRENLEGLPVFVENSRVGTGKNARLLGGGKIVADNQDSKKRPICEN